MIAVRVSPTAAPGGRPKTRSGVVARQPAFLLLVGPEVLRREPRLVTGLQPCPVAVGHREPPRVPVLALDHHVLAEHALEGEAEALRGTLGRLVEVVALPLETPIPERVEDVAGEQVERLGDHAGARNRRAPQDVADLDDAMLG